jgi:serine/threonine-protein kinase RsbW
MPTERSALSLVLNNHVDVLEYVQAACDDLCSRLPLDEDAVHWVGVAVRESVVNAIRHGNQNAPDKHVEVDFVLMPSDAPVVLEVTVRDQGKGFEPEDLLKSSGRGIFFMRNFMDDVELRRRPEGGMEVFMRKRLSGPSA